ncbi:MAG: hypothetical protein ACYCOO_03880 [Chitinophagaceae bacterium]
MIVDFLKLARIMPRQLDCSATEYNLFLLDFTSIHFVDTLQKNK